MQVAIGDRVAYSVQWLRSIGTITGELPAARGTITELQDLGGLVLATIDWGNPDIPPRVNVNNLAIVGPNTRFCAC